VTTVDRIITLSNTIAEDAEAAISYEARRIAANIAKGAGAGAEAVAV